MSKLTNKVHYGYSQVNVINFDALSDRQHEVLGCIAVNQDAGHNIHTLYALERLGLIESYPETIPGQFPATIRRYRVPIHVHVQWCAWCSRNVKDEDLP